MSNNRRIGRECALKMLFSFKFDVDQSDSVGLVNSFWQNFHFADDALGEPLVSAAAVLPTASRIFAETLVKGVIEFRSVIDQKIIEVAQNWSIERMAPVDLSILRIGAYELLYLADIPARVSINEAIEIAKRYGAKESPAFINGLLDKIAQSSDKKP